MTSTVSYFSTRAHTGVTPQPVLCKSSRTSLERVRWEETGELDSVLIAKGSIMLYNGHEDAFEIRHSRCHQQ